MLSTVHANFLGILEGEAFLGSRGHCNLLGWELLFGDVAPIMGPCRDAWHVRPRADLYHEQLLHS